MSFLSELFHGKLDWGNLAPQNIFKDTVSSFENQPGWAKALEIALPAVALGGVGLGALADVGAVGAGAAAEGGLGAAEAAGAGAGAAFADPTEAALFAGAAGDPTAAALAGGGAAGLPAAAEPAALTGSVFDTGFAGEVPFTNMTLGGGFPSVEGGPGAGGVFDFSPSTEIATGYPGAGGGAGGGATFAGGPSADVASIQGLTDAAPPGGLTGGAGPVDLGRAVYSGGAMQGIEGVGPVAQPETPGVLGSIGSTLKSAAPWMGAAGLGYNLFQGYQSQKALQALQQQETDYQNRIAQAGQASLSAAQPLLAAGQALTTGGPIPAGMQAILDNYRNAQRARVIQSYTSQGLPGDPNKNTSLMQDLNAVDNQMLALQESLGTQMIDTANKMLSSGASATQIAAELPMMMQRLDIALQQQTGNAIANFAAAMSGGTMKVSGQGAGQNINISTGNPLLQ